MIGAEVFDRKVPAGKIMERVMVWGPRQTAPLCVPVGGVVFVLRTRCYSLGVGSSGRN
jgi:hypothetical protein